MPEHDDQQNWEEDQGPSKSEMKRRMTALQSLGESLTQLSEKQLSQIPIEDDKLLQAIREARNIGSNSARRRHMQFIGKLMRDIEPDPIAKALQSMHRQHQQANDAFHQLEELRDDMIAAGTGGLELAIERWPEADRQHLRQLLLQHQREMQRNKPPAASRKLFRYLKELQELYG